MKLHNGEISARISKDESSDSMSLRLILRSPEKKYAAKIIEWIEVPEGSEFPRLAQIDKVESFNIPSMNQDFLSPVAIPEQIFEELERLHKLLLSENHHTVKDWAKEAISKIHSLYLNGRLVLT